MMELLLRAACLFFVNKECVRSSVCMLQMHLIKKLKTSFQIKFSNNQRFLCHTMGSKTVVFDSTSWEKIAELSKPKDPGYIQFSQNDDYLYIKRTIGTICVYETEGFQLIKTIKSNKKFKLVEADFAITNTPFLILDTLNTKDGYQLALINIEQGEHTVLTDFKDSTLIELNQFIEAENSYLFTMTYENTRGYIDHQIVKVTEPIEKGSIEVIHNSEIWYWESIIYSSIHSIYIVVQNYDLVILDGKFKKVLRKFSITNDKYPECLGYFQHIHLSNSGQFIIITYSKTVLILGYDDLEPIVVEKIQYACFGEFSHDDRFLLIGTYENGYILENTLL
ncbi:hypothetical protein L1999_13585 [Neobacillus drentensis]|uniref:hypothetical protein n=1 Tax=Neobacillus drentensis TaxID=220684 RepID=UPI001F2CD9B1|nr:hypothetical protein [Neobacillus drentensis]ULT59486.1 hypothetical protein L1999_13585 [Neobacillus drentensis]